MKVRCVLFMLDDVSGPLLNLGVGREQGSWSQEGGFLVIFEIIGEIEQIETIAIGGNIHDIMRLQKQYGPGRWRKVKGVALVRLQSGRICKAELHWYEAHGVGRKKLKIKRFLN